MLQNLSSAAVVIGALRDKFTATISPKDKIYTPNIFVL